MKDFDAARKAGRASEEERTFRIGGEVFVARAENHPDVVAGYDRIGDDTSITETLKIVDEVLEQMIEPSGGGAGAVSRYRAVRARTDDIVTVDDLLTLVTWLMSLQTGVLAAEPDADPLSPVAPIPMTPGPFPLVGGTASSGGGTGGGTIGAPVLGGAGGGMTREVAGR